MVSTRRLAKDEMIACYKLSNKAVKIVCLINYLKVSIMAVQVVIMD